MKRDGARGLSPRERRASAALMRVNHAGEIAAQALYNGQALFARAESTRELLANAAREERDHLAWCASRVEELGGRTSRLTPLWYAGSFAIGVLAGLRADAESLGFVRETERQVEAHLRAVATGRKLAERELAEIARFGERQRLFGVF